MRCFSRGSPLGSWSPEPLSTGPRRLGPPLACTGSPGDRPERRQGPEEGEPAAWSHKFGGLDGGLSRWKALGYPRGVTDADPLAVAQLLELVEHAELAADNAGRLGVAVRVGDRCGRSLAWGEEIGRRRGRGTSPGPPIRAPTAPSARSPRAASIHVPDAPGLLTNRWPPRNWDPHQVRSPFVNLSNQTGRPATTGRSLPPASSRLRRRSACRLASSTFPSLISS